MATSAATNKWTMLDLVQMVSKIVQTDEEIVATVATLVNSNTVQLCGNFAGAKIEIFRALPCIPLVKEGDIGRGVSSCAPPSSS